MFSVFNNMLNRNSYDDIPQLVDDSEVMDDVDFLPNDLPDGWDQVFCLREGAIVAKPDISIEIKGDIVTAYETNPPHGAKQIEIEHEQLMNPEEFNQEEVQTINTYLNTTRNIVKELKASYTLNERGIEEYRREQEHESQSQNQFGKFFDALDDFPKQIDSRNLFEEIDMDDSEEVSFADDLFWNNDPLDEQEPAPKMETPRAKTWLQSIRGFIAGVYHKITEFFRSCFSLFTVRG